MRHRLLWSALLLPLALTTALADGGAPDPFRAAPEDYGWWRDARFGMFIHWGPVSLRGTEIGWSRGGPRPGTGGTGEVPLAEYDSLYQRFNPTEFDADEWVALAKAAGMKYLVFTSKHHDGFVMFDSALTDYKITNSPFRRDVVRELARACHKAGIRFGLYYSPPDWHHPDFLTPNHARYVDYFHGQIRELLTHYGQVDVLWFDGLGGTAKDYGSEELLPEVRALQPHILINNRSGLPADFDTPEQTIGTFQTSRPWESCITIANQWAYRPNDETKSLKQCIDTLVRCSGGDGNLLLNVGPMPTGAIEPLQVERLREMGAWLRQHGETIYGTRGGPFRPGKWGAATCRGKTVYLHLLDPALAEVKLPPIDARVLASRVLTGGEVRVRQDAESVVVTVKPGDQQALDTIVALELDQPAFETVTGSIASGSLAFHRPAKASNVFQNAPQYGPEAALDDSLDTRWATDYGVRAVTLEFDLGKERSIGRAYLSEEYDRVTSWDLEVREGDTWRSVYHGERIGHECEVSFAAVTARWVRLNIHEATEGPTLWEVQVFAPLR